MLKFATAVIVALVGVVGVVGVGIVAVRLVRTARGRRIAALAAGPRRALLAFVADNGEDGAVDLVAIPEEAWRAAEPGALALLGKLRGEAHQALVAVFLHRGVARRALRDLTARGPVRRARAAQVLGDLELRQAVPPLCRLLDDRHGEVRVVAVRALGRIGDPIAAWRLLASLDTADPTPALLVSHTLVQLGPGTEVTLSAALDHPEARVRTVCLASLGLLGAAGSVARVARVLRDDPDLDVRVAAAASLGKLGARAALEPLIDALGETRPVPLRAAAAQALGDLGAPSAAPHLAALVDAAEYRVAHEAAHALRRLGPAGVDALRQVIARETSAAPPAPAGAPTTPPAARSPATAHAREALAIADLSGVADRAPARLARAAT